MFDTGFLIMAMIVAGLLGVVLGRLSKRFLGSDKAQLDALNQALAQSEADQQEYRQQVAGHFTQTAMLLNDLTERYKDVHQHLASGADALCRDSDGHSLLGGQAESLGAASSSALPGASSEASASPQPPLDYAPKTETTEPGTLAEDYGLEKVNLGSDDDPEQLDLASVTGAADNLHPGPGSHSASAGPASTNPASAETAAAGR